MKTKNPEFDHQSEIMTPEHFAALNNDERMEYFHTTYETRRALETVACLRIDLRRCDAQYHQVKDERDRVLDSTKRVYAEWCEWDGADSPTWELHEAVLDLAEILGQIKQDKP